jgi:uncharacterized membrane protein
MIDRSANAIPSAAGVYLRDSRIDSLDLLRGVVMVLMALDHARDFFWLSPYDPTDLAHTNALAFATRWVTHLCAPVFVFLAGTGAWLSRARGKSRTALAHFLLTRGFWLIVLELTVVKLGWESYNYDVQYYRLQVIWALGVSMIALAGLVFLPLRVIFVLGAGMIVGHNLLDSLTPASFGSLRVLWRMLHVAGALGAAPGKGWGVFIVYPLIPWIGVMALGYCFGSLLTEERLRIDSAARQRLFLRMGIVLVATFLLIRAVNGYGDLHPWTVQSSFALTVMSYLNVAKYPPSLDYLLATLGLSSIALAGCERWRGRSADFALVYGRVPLFFYVLHLLLLHHIMLSIYRMDAGMWPSYDSFKSGWGGLGQTYVAWFCVVVILYFPCRWYGRLKARRRDWWLSYL